MNYGSVNFIFYILFVILIFACLPSKLKSIWILAASIIWYITWSYVWIGIFLAIIALNYFSLRWITKKRDHRDRSFYFLTIVNVCILVALKSLPAINPKFTTPNGTSFFMLILIGMVVDLWREKKEAIEYGLSDFFNLPIFFPLLMGGPIEKGKNFFPQIKKMDFSFEQVSDGILIFTLGFFKKIFISDILLNSSLFDGLNNFLLEGLFNTFLTYFIFSSYCDMGRGVAKTLGIDLTINFRPFYYSKNPNDFWQRWNIALGTWIRDYVTFPMLFKWGRKLNPNIIIIFSFILVGLWHGIEWHWLVFGLFNGLVIFLYNTFSKKLPSFIYGQFLAICIWIGNGVFNQKDFLIKLSKPLSFPQSFYFNDTHLTYLIPALAALFIIEFFQEKRGTDFYLKFPSNIKYVFSLILIVVFTCALKMNWDTNIDELPPIYFRI